MKACWNHDCETFWTPEKTSKGINENREERLKNSGNCACSLPPILVEQIALGIKDKVHKRALMDKLPTGTKQKVNLMKPIRVIHGGQKTQKLKF